MGAQEKLKTEILIGRADPRDYGELLAASDVYAAALYPAESNHMLDIDVLCQPAMHFYGVTIGGVARGCGGFWAHADYVEIKRVFIDPAARGLGISKQLMTVLENGARDLGYQIARLETGIYQPEALGLYRALNYRDVPPFGEYHLDTLSVFMEKAL